MMIKELMYYTLNGKKTKTIGNCKHPPVSITLHNHSFQSKILFFFVCHYINTQKIRKNLPLIIIWNSNSICSSLSNGNKKKFEKEKFVYELMMPLTENFKELNWKRYRCVHGFM